MNPTPNYQIIAIQLSASTNNRGYRHIDYVYLQPKPNVEPPRVERAWLAEEIDAHRTRAMVLVGGYEVPVGVEHLNGQKYLRTRSDDTVDDNLLHLPTYNAAGQLLVAV